MRRRDEEDGNGEEEQREVEGNECDKGEENGSKRARSEGRKEKGFGDEK